MQSSMLSGNGMQGAGALAGLKHSVVLADPSLGDSIIIGCSEGFQELSGFSRLEVIGKSCCFLTEGCFNQPSLIEAMNAAIANGDEFLGVMVSRRKSGEQFSNLLHLFSVVVGGKRYVLLLQANVGHVPVNLADPMHVAHLRQVAVAILSADVDTWVLQQLAEFYRLRLRKPMPLNEILPPQPCQQELPVPVPGPSFLMQPPPGACAAQFMPPQPMFQKESRSNMLQMPVAANVQNFRADWSASGASAAPSVAPSAASPASTYSGYGHSEKWQATLQTQEGGKFPSHVNKGNNFEGLLDQEDQEKFARSMSSIGSESHPDNCTECQFHFFSSSGCRMGSDCRFCHLFHPRKCQRKNKKILKRLESQLKVEDEVSMTPSSTASICFPGTEKGTVVIKTFRYLKEVFPTKKGGRPPRATFQVGAKLRLIPTMEFEDSRGQAIMSRALFTVNPPLPDGVVLNEHTGVISGISLQASPRDLYTVTLSAPAESLTGISIGVVPLAKSCMSIRILQQKPQELAEEDEPKQPEQVRPGEIAYLPKAADKGAYLPMMHGEVMPQMTANDRQAGG